MGTTAESDACRLQLLSDKLAAQATITNPLKKSTHVCLGVSMGLADNAPWLSGTHQDWHIGELGKDGILVQVLQ